MRRHRSASQPVGRIVPVAMASVALPIAAIARWAINPRQAPLRSCASPCAKTDAIMAFVERPTSVNAIGFSTKMLIKNVYPLAIQIV